MANFNDLPGGLAAHMSPAELRTAEMLRLMHARKAMYGATKKMSLGGHLEAERFARETRGLVPRPGGGVYTPVGEDESDEYRRLEGGAEAAGEAVLGYNELSPEEKRALFSPETEMELGNMAARGAHAEGVIGDLERRNAALEGILTGETAQRDRPNPMLGGGPMPAYYQGADRFPTGAPINVWASEQRARKERSERALAIADEQMHGRRDPVTGEHITYPDGGRREFMSFHFRPGEIIGDSPEDWRKIERRVREISGEDASKWHPGLREAIQRRSQRGLTDFANELYANPDSMDFPKMLAFFEELRGTPGEAAKPTDMQTAYKVLKGTLGNIPLLPEWAENKILAGMRDVMPEGEFKPGGGEAGTGRLGEIRAGVRRGVEAGRLAEANLEASRTARMETPRGQRITQRLHDEREVAKRRAMMGLMTPAERVEAIRGRNALGLAQAQGGANQVQNPMQNQILMLTMVKQLLGDQPITPENIRVIIDALKQIKGINNGEEDDPNRFPVGRNAAPIGGPR